MADQLEMTRDRFSVRNFALSPDVARLGRYIVSGGSAATVNLGLLYVLTSLIGVWYVYSAVIAYLVSFAISFSMQKFWTFRSSSLGAIPRQLPLYFVIQTLDLWIATYGLYLLVEYLHIWYLLASFLMMAAIAVWNFFLFNFLIFKRESA